MKPAHTQFRDQVSTLVSWFSNWNECEQTIALYTLLKRISNTQARFLSLILEHTFRDDPVEIQILQKQANDKDFLLSLSKERKDVAVHQLLKHLPLLAPGNDKARYEYLQLLPKILTHSVQNLVHQDECMQLLSLALVHPAFPPEERNSLLCWLSHLEKTMGIKERQNSGPARLQTTDSSDHCDNLVRQNYMSGRMNGWRNQQLVHRDSGIGSSFDMQPTYGSYSSMGSSMSSMMRKSRSNSLTPPPTVEEQDSLLVDDYHECLQVETRPGRSQSFPVDPHHLTHQLSPQSSTESEQDESFLCQRVTSGNENAKPGMKDVPVWLKSLRLHKYGSLFSQLSYEEMLELDDNHLESKGVTKGARNKILISIKRLKERGEALQKLEKEVLQTNKLQHVLTELKQIVNTPIKPFNPPPGIPTTISEGNTASGAVMEQASNVHVPPHPEDLPAWVTRVMGKACTQILVSRADEEHCTLYLQLLDRTLMSEAFTPNQKRRLHSWKQQCQKLARQQQFARRPSSQEKSKGWYYPYFANPPIDTVNSLCPPAGPGGVPKRRGSPRNVSKGPSAGQRSNSTETQPSPSKARLVRAHAIVGRTKSLPIRSTVSQGSLQQQNSADMDGIDDGLESLCLRMTEQALSDSSSDRT